MNTFFMISAVVFSWLFIHFLVGKPINQTHAILRGVWGGFCLGAVIGYLMGSGAWLGN